MDLNARQRFHRIMHFQEVDRVPVWSVEAVAEGAIRRWIRDEGFPIGRRLSDVIRLDPRETITLDTDPLPSFVERTIDENERWRTTIDRYGFTVRTLKEHSVSPVVYYYVDGVVSDRHDWEELKKRYDPTDPRRKPHNWGAELIDYYDDFAGPVEMRINWGPGRGVKNGYTMGLEQFLEVLTRDPELVKDMLNFWADFIIEVSRDFVTRCRIDFACFEEDGIGYKNSSLVSPWMYREIWIPPMRRVADFLHEHGIDVIGHWSSGNVTPLIPDLLDIGVNLFLPLEVAAGMDARDLRRKFGRDILMIGNVSRQALMDGLDAVEEEFYTKVPPLMEEGGYIPAVDDMIMPDMSFESYRRYIDLVRNFGL